MIIEYIKNLSKAKIIFSETFMIEPGEKINIDKVKKDDLILSLDNLKIYSDINEVSFISDKDSIGTFDNFKKTLENKKIIENETISQEDSKKSETKEQSATVSEIEYEQLRTAHEKLNEKSKKLSEDLEESKKTQAVYLKLLTLPFGDNKIKPADLLVYCSINKIDTKDKKTKNELLGIIDEFRTNS